MAINSNLMKAILSMDAYNRGYDAGIKFGSEEGNNSEDDNGIIIGNATILANSSSLVGDNGNNEIDDDIGFYALAYNYNGETVISYRGTNDVDGIPNPLTDLDVYHGWSLGGGFTSSEQGRMAIDFYNEVAKADNSNIAIDPRFANISTTGHSLGGGLAGYVSALYDKDATVFDSMTFELAARKTSEYYVTIEGPFPAGVTVIPMQPSEVDSYVPPAGATITAVTPVAPPELLLMAYDYNNTGNPDYSAPWDLDFAGIEHYYVKGETLETMLPLRDNGASPPVINPPYTLGYEGELLDGTDLHSMASLVIRMFADETEVVGNDWEKAAQYFWPVMYDKNSDGTASGFAQSIGMDNISGVLADDNKHASILRQIIAYSAIDEGDVSARPFGDTAIRALYDDANDLGAALSSSGAVITSKALKTYCLHGIVFNRCYQYTLSV